MATQVTIAEFTGADPLDAEGNPYVDITFEEPYESEDHWAQSSGLNLASGGGVAVWIEESSRTGAGCRVKAADQIVGTVPVITTNVLP